MSSTPNSDVEVSNYDLDGFTLWVTSITKRERLRDILVLIYDELSMRHRGERWEQTGFEDATYNDLRHLSLGAKEHLPSGYIVSSL